MEVLTGLYEAHAKGQTAMAVNIDLDQEGELVDAVKEGDSTKKKFHHFSENSRYIGPPRNKEMGCTACVRSCPDRVAR